MARIRMPSKTQKGLLNLQSGTYGGTGERLQYSYYDTYKLVTSATSHGLFKRAVGGAVSYSDTNMSIPGQIPQGQKINVHALRVTFTPAAVLDATTILNATDFFARTYFKFVINNKAPVLEGTLSDLLGGAFNGAVAGAATNYLSSTQASPATGILPLNVPIILAAQTPFNIDLTFGTAIPAGLNNSYLKFSLDGILIRAL